MDSGSKNKAVSLTSSLNMILHNYNGSDEDDDGSEMNDRNKSATEKMETTSEETNTVIDTEENSLFLFTKDTAADKAVKLISESGVDIEEKCLRDIKRKAATQNVLARMLMCNIFKENVLLKYNFTGKKNTNALPRFAVDVILKFVPNTAKRAKWKVTDNRYVMDSFRSKLKEMKSKATGKTQIKQ